MATFTAQFRSWRAQVRRKGKYVNETFLRRKDAEEWALEIERRIDRGEAALARSSRDTKTFGDLIQFTARIFKRSETVWTLQNLKSALHSIVGEPANRGA